MERGPAVMFERKLYGGMSYMINHQQMGALGLPPRGVAGRAAVRRISCTIRPIQSGGKQMVGRSDIRANHRRWAAVAALSGNRSVV